MGSDTTLGGVWLESDGTGAVSQEDNPIGGSSGGPVAGEGVGSHDEVQSQLAALEERRRYYQGLSDKQNVKIKDLEAKLSDFERVSQELTELKDQISSFKAPSVEELAAVLERQQRLADFRVDLAKRYPGIDVSGLGGSPEEMEQAARAAHEAREAEAARVREEVERRVREEYAAKFGSLDPNADAMDQGDRGVPGGGTMSVEAFERADWTTVGELSDAEFSKWIQELEAKEAAEQK